MLKEYIDRFRTMLDEYETLSVYVMAVLFIVGISLIGIILGIIAHFFPLLFIIALSAITFVGIFGPITYWFHKFFKLKV